jgi:hypothetical protein
VQIPLFHGSGNKKYQFMWKDRRDPLDVPDDRDLAENSLPKGDLR